jgi:hypothetical protein
MRAVPCGLCRRSAMLYVDLGSETTEIAGLCPKWVSLDAEMTMRGFIGLISSQTRVSGTHG